MFGRWMHWAWSTTKLTLLIAGCWVAATGGVLLFVGASATWIVVTLGVVGFAAVTWIALNREPMRAVTLARPRVGPEREARRSWAWLRRAWEPMCRAAGLAGNEFSPGSGKRLYPKIKRVSMGPRGPVWEVEVLVGMAQTPDLWIRRADVLSSFVGWPLEVSAAGARRVRIEMLTRSPLREPRFVPLETKLDLTRALTIGIQADGNPFRLPLVEKQTLLVGASGSGKGSVIASTLAALGPGIQGGTVTVDAIDLKGGVEAGTYEGLLRTSAWDYESAQTLLRDLVQELEDRLTTMRMGGLRKIEPNTATPLRLLIIDEAASLTYLAPDSKSKAEVDLLLKRILSTGRAAGYVVLAALQDPRKEALASRDLYTQTLALRFRTKDDAVLAIGQSAYDAGARCEQIPTATPGTGYAIDGETGDVVQFRAFWASDNDLKEMVRRYAPRIGEGTP